MNICCGIYSITCTLNNKMYVGYSRNIYKRFSKHKKDLNRQKHENYYLQQAWNKHGEDNFVFEVIEECTSNLLSALEHYWVTILNLRDNKLGYNIRPTHPDNTTLVTPEIVEKIRIANLGRKPSPESIRKGIETRKKKAIKDGYFHSEETRKKISQANMGRKNSEEAIRASSEKQRGKKISIETIRKMTETRKKNGYKHSEETKRKISISNIGKKHRKSKKDA